MAILCVELPAPVAVWCHVSVSTPIVISQDLRSSMVTCKSPLWFDYHGKINQEGAVKGLFFSASGSLTERCRVWIQA